MTAKLDQDPEVVERRTRATLRAKIRMSEVCAELRPKRERAQWLAKADDLRAALAQKGVQ